MTNDITWGRLEEDMKQYLENRNFKTLANLYLIFSGLSQNEIDSGPENISDKRLAELGYKRIV